MALVKEEFLKEIESMSVMELHELVEAIKEKFGVTGAVAVAAGGGGAAEGGAEAEKSAFNVVLKETGANKIAVIKEIKAILDIKLGDAKAIAEAPGKPIKENVEKKDAEEMKTKLEAAGATIELV